MPTVIAIVDSDPALCAAVRDHFANAGLDVHVYPNVATFRDGVVHAMADVVISALRLPGEDGLALLHWVRGFSPVPVILLHDDDEAVDCIVGLELGADDCVAKPCDLRELLARVRARLRRVQYAAPLGTPVAAVSAFAATTALVPEVWFGRWRLDRARRRLVDAGGQECPITGADFALLQIFADHPREVLSRERLIELAGIPAHELEARAIDMRIARLRRKIEPLPNVDTVIRTLRGRGRGFEFLPSDPQTRAVGCP